MIKLKKREKLAKLKQIISQYEHYLLTLTISQDGSDYNTGFNNALTKAINDIRIAGILDD